MSEFNIKSKTAGQCRVYPDSPNGLQPSVTSICGALMKYGLIQWAADCAVDYIKETARDMGDAKTAVCYWSSFDEARHAHEQIKDDAADTGTDAHKICEKWLMTLFGPDIVGAACDFHDLYDKAGDDMKTMVQSFMEWATKNKIEPVHTEIVLHGDGYSGRGDLIAYRTDPKTKERRLGLYDIKTGKGSYYPEWGLQLAAYAEAFESYTMNRSMDGANGDVYQEIQEIGIIKLNKETLKCNFSEDRGPKFTQHRERLTDAWKYLVKFYWLYNELNRQFEEISASDKINDFVNGLKEVESDINER